MVIPNSVTDLGVGAFYGCTSLNSITIPEGITYISMWAFMGCDGLTSITLPKTLTSIGEESFWNCTSLKSITIPENVTDIGDNAFYDCKNLERVVCRVKPVLELENVVFNHTTNATLYVPAEALGSYRATKPWSDFKTILPLEE